MLLACKVSSKESMTSRGQLKRFKAKKYTDGPVS